MWAGKIVLGKLDGISFFFTWEYNLVRLTNIERITVREFGLSRRYTFVVILHLGTLGNGKTDKRMDEQTNEWTE